MKKRNYLSQGRRRNRRTKRAINLTVEALEPRLVFSAVGFGFEGVGERFEFPARDYGNRDTYRAALTEKNHDQRSNPPFDLSGRPTDRNNTNLNRLEFRSPKPGPDGHPRVGRPHEPFSANLYSRGARESHFDEHSAESFDSFEGWEDESTTSKYEFEDFSSSESAGGIVEPNLFAETTIPSTRAVFISRTPTTSLTHGNDSLSFGQPTTRLMQPPRTVSTDSVSPQSGSAARLPAFKSVSSPASNRTTPTLETPIIRFDSAFPDSDSVFVQRASESTKRIAEPGIETFVLLADNDLARWWNGDGEPFEAAFETSDAPTEPVRPAVAIEQAVTSLVDFADNRRARLSEESLWARVSEGGFIEIDANKADISRERFELVEDSEDISGPKRLPTQTVRDAFWFDLGDTRLELILDSSGVEEWAEEQALDDADGAGEEAWLLDDGGMIVLTSSQFIDQPDDVAVDATSESSSTGETAASGTDIPMDAGIVVFQAIEVAAAPVEPQETVEGFEDTPVPIERAGTADVDDGIAPAEQAAKNSASDQSEPSRAASMPPLLALSAFLLRRRVNRKKVANLAKLKAPDPQETRVALTSK